jgi:hypothetical protein
MTSAGMDPQDPQVLMRRWGVNKTLSWKISKVVQTDDAFLALQQVPGREGIDVLLKKGAAAGVNPASIQATRAAVDRFEKLIEVHCGDRVTFEIMGSDITPAGRQQREEHHRKLLYQGASYVWGVQARMYLNLRVLAPAAEAGLADIACIAGLLDFRRLRENVRWPMFKRQTRNPDGTPFTHSKIETLDPASANEVVPFMTEFYSPAKTASITYEDNTATVEMAPGPVGNAGVTSYLLGIIERGLPNTAPVDQTNPQANLWSLLNTPAEALLFDIYIHESLTSAMPPKPVLARMSGNSPPVPAELERSRLPMFESLLDLGTAITAPFTAEVPRYGEIFNSIFARTGWTASQFHGFRLRMAYPPVMSALAMQYGIETAVPPTAAP